MYKNTQTITTTYAEFIKQPSISKSTAGRYTTYILNRANLNKTKIGKRVLCRKVTQLNSDSAKQKVLDLKKNAVIPVYVAGVPFDCLFDF